MIKTILFVELLGGIGDVLIALPAIQALARSHPQARLTVLTFAPGSELLFHHPLIHQVAIANPGEARQAVENLLYQQTFDLIISDTNYDDIAEILQSNAGTRAITNLWRNPPDRQRVGDRFLQILQEEGLVAPEAVSDLIPLIHLTNAEQTQAAETLGVAYRPLIVFIPEAGMPIKRWSLTHFITLGKALLQNYGGTILVLVGEDERSAQKMVRGINGSAYIWPRSSLRELAAIIAKADLAIGADTGPMRMAAALHVPTITLFGPSWHERYGQPTPHINLQGYPQCPERIISNFTQQSCWYSGECPFVWDSCTDAILPDTVLQAAGVTLSGGVRECSTRGVSLAPNPRETLLPQWSNVRNLLVMRLDNIGDVIMTSPALRAIKKHLPQTKLTLMASHGGALAAPLLLWVDEVLPWRVLWQDLGKLAFDPTREWKLIDTLASRRFDAAIIFTSFSQSPHPPATMCYLAGIPLRLGESKENGLGILTHTVPPSADDVHQVERNLRLIESVGFQVEDRHLALTIQGGEVPVPNSYLLLNPWTSCQSRNYDGMRFAMAALQLSEITGLPVVITGVEKDRDRTHPLLKLLGDRAIDWVGKTNLTELAALVANAKLVLTNNTSTMHIADATHTPSVILFAGTELECQWRPRFAPVKLLRRPTVCSPCYTFTCPYELQCLDISPEAVVAAGLELLEHSAAGVTPER